MAAPVKEIKFLAVARRSDKALLCTRVHSTDKSYDYVANVQRVLTSPGWASVTTDKLSLDDGGNMFYMLIDEVRGGGAEAMRGAWVEPARAMLVPADTFSRTRLSGEGTERRRAAASRGRSRISPRRRATSSPSASSAWSSRRSSRSQRTA